MNPHQVVAEMQRTIPTLESEARASMRRAVDVTRDRMVSMAPRRSGKLAGSIGATVHATGEGVSGTVRPRERYAEFVERGTGEYVEHHARISPKAGRTARGGAALKFKGEGGTVFRRSVKGQKPQRFVERTRDDVLPHVEDLLAHGAELATRKLFG